MKIFGDIGLCVPIIFLPKKGIDLAKWSVVACDQYTSQPEYWKRVEAFVGKAPSTLHLIFPEAYLEKEGAEKRILNINKKMQEYLDKEIIVSQNKGFILVDRKTAHAKSRKGLIVALDLEKYDYNPGSRTLIRATEGTIISRLPPRIKVREKAAIELPHIMILIDDPQKTVIEPLFEMNHKLLYDFELMENSGHIKGYLVDEQKLIAKAATSLGRLSELAYFEKKYDVNGKGVLLYAVGDGNHSLATAKAAWEKIKKGAGNNKGIMAHPARYSLVELVNVHDPGLAFEPIHRLVFNIDPKEILCAMEAFYEKEEILMEQNYTIEEKDRREGKYHSIYFISEKIKGKITVKNPSCTLAVGTLQAFLDKYLKSAPAAKIDYIHSREVAVQLGSEKGNIGFILPAMEKEALFRTVIVNGTLPRKTFSMGEADEKRFYLECRRIAP